VSQPVQDLEWGDLDEAPVDIRDTWVTGDSVGARQRPQLVDGRSFLDELG
jgi:hypothetical protein